MGLEIECTQCGERVGFSASAEDRLPMTRDCPDCGATWTLAAYRVHR